MFVNPQSSLGTKNKQRILDIINQINSKSGSVKSKSKKRRKSKSKRKSPSKSATLFSVGKVLKGNDGNKWIIKKNKNGIKRWVKN